MMLGYVIFVIVIIIIIIIIIILTLSFMNDCLYLQFNAFDKNIQIKKASWYFTAIFRSY